MEHTDLEIEILSKDQLASYEPAEKFWLQRQLWANGSSDDNVRLLVIRVSFVNRSTVDLEMNFSNDTCKAELHNLQVESSDGKRVVPERNIHIRPKHNTHTPTVLKPGDKSGFDLVAEVRGREIIFPGTKRGRVSFLKK